MLVGQFYVAQNTVSEMVKFNNMGATLRRSDSTLSQAAFSMTVAVPAPGAFALLGVAGLASRRRRA
jgi:MYXO-CTERM domain-containing protein